MDNTEREKLSDVTWSGLKVRLGEQSGTTGWSPFSFVRLERSSKLEPSPKMKNEPKFIRISELATDRKNGRYGLLPMCKATIWNNVKNGTFPKPIKLTANITAWRISDIEMYINQQSTIEEAA